jgi:hypothetical protein
MEQAVKLTLWYKIFFEHFTIIQLAQHFNHHLILLGLQLMQNFITNQKSGTAHRTEALINATLRISNFVFFNIYFNIIRPYMP